MRANDQGAERRERLAAARLYLVCAAGLEESSNDERPLAELIREAVAGGVDVVQLREKHLPDEKLVAVANAARVLCERLGVLMIVNDRPFVAREARADGVHVGQDDMSPAEVREIVGPDMLVGLSTHAPEEIDAVDPALVDYIGVGPIHETPTKPGRAAVGLELIRYAAEHAAVPFFAIGGLHAGNLAETLQAGASRVCVLRAISGAGDPRSAARSLRGQLAPHEPGAPR
ncbi:MAG: thiamine phosphate synthase [Solirubrobacteraceae bacterium]|jgi:thiamine-phosphate pyrophosphorylase